MSNKSTMTIATMAMILARIRSMSLPRSPSLATAESGHAARSKLSAMPPRRIGLKDTSPDLKLQVYGRGLDVGVQAAEAEDRAALMFR